MHSVIIDYNKENQIYLFYVYKTRIITHWWKIIILSVENGCAEWNFILLNFPANDIIYFFIYYLFNF